MRPLVGGLILLALPALPASALAGPLTAGASVGLTQSKADATLSPNHTLGLFARLQVAPRVAGQVEALRVQTDDNSNVEIRSAIALLVVDLGSDPRWVPTLAAGVGLDRASFPYADNADTARHIEGGVGLEYRAMGGFTIGAELRLGTRELDPSNIRPLATDGYSALYLPSTLRAGEYRSVRISAGIRF